ncbi:MAG: response regulator transcription factor [Saprospiraceae bacterium]
MKILLIEDEPVLASSIQEFLLTEGYQVEYASNFQSALEKVAIYTYDCLLVDINLPGGGSGLDVLRNLKKQHPETGVIIISAQNSLDDKIVGLDLGADDYLTKPFHLSELNARIKAILRRRQFDGNSELVFAEILVQLPERQVFVNNIAIELTRKEYDLLLFFLANKNRVLTREAIAEHLWGDDADQFDCFDFIYSHIKNLRKKLTENGAGDYLKAVYGVGYKFIVDR